MQQPRGGYRIAVDTLLLAAATPAGARVVDVGAGVGGAALALARTTAAGTVLALERDRRLARLLRANIEANGLVGRVAAVVGDLARPPLAAGAADVVMTNPPYGAAAAGTLPATALGRAARHEAALDLAAWLGACARLVRGGGEVVVVHRADRLPELLAPLGSDVAVLPLWPRAGVPAKRVLVRARIGRRGPARLLSGLVLHDAEGHFTPEADAILRGEARLSWNRG